MFTVSAPADMNTQFAQAFNSREISHLLALYEDDAVLCTDFQETKHIGRAAITTALTSLLTLPGTMVARNRFCVESGNIALLSARWTLHDDHGQVIAQGETAEVVRRQADGRWLYAIDHAMAWPDPKMAIQ